MLIPFLYLYRPHEDLPLFREVRNYAAMLGVGELRSVAEVADLPDDVPGCLIVRVESDVRRACDLLEGIREYELPLSVVFLADAVRAEDVVTLVRSGAAEVLQRPLERTRLHNSLRSAAATSASLLAKRCRAAPLRRKFETLSAGEREVLRLILAGESNKRTANVLGIAVRTVEARRCRIFSKLGTFSSAEIAAMLITADPSFAEGTVDLAALQASVFSFRRAIRKRSRSVGTSVSERPAASASLGTPTIRPEVDFPRSLIG